jgi:hypothetical protein
MSANTSKAGVAKINYTDEPIEAKVIRDFLPPPEELAYREEGVTNLPSLTANKRAAD